MKTTKRIICTKDLVMDSGERSFTKGNEYQLASETGFYGVINDRTILIDNAGDHHVVGNWAKYFKLS
jgi:hypothetical protein